MTTTAEKVVDKRRALGRGLESLLPSGPRVVGTAAAVSASGAHSSVAEFGEARREDAIMRLPLDQIEENPYQTRLQFSEQALNELAESIRANGIVQPIVVRPSANGKFALILGERRCRAAKLAGETTVPAIVRQVSNEQAAEMTVVENLQRQDLNCLEQAKAFSRLSREFGLTQEQIGQKTGCSRESVANYLRLLKLPEEIQQHLASGELGFSEARVLLQLSDPQLIAGVAKQAIAMKMSVAQLSDVVDRLNLPPEGKAEAPERVVDPNVRAAESELAQLLGCKVRINDRKGKGKIVIEYSTLDDFDRVMEMLKGEN